MNARIKPIATGAAVVVGAALLTGGVLATRQTASPATATKTTASALPSATPTSTPTPTATPTSTPAPTPPPTAAPTPPPTPRPTAVAPTGPRLCTPADFYPFSLGPRAAAAKAGSAYSVQSSFEFGPSANACSMPASVGRNWITDASGATVTWCPVNTMSYTAQIAPAAPDQSGGIGVPVQLSCTWPAGATGAFKVHDTITVTSSGRVLLNSVTNVTAS